MLPTRPWGLAPLKPVEHLVKFSPQGAFDVQHYHKNLHRLREGKQPLKNIPHHTSFVPHSYNFGRIVGALHRVTRSSIGTPNTIRGCMNLLDEHIFSMQFPVKLILQAIYRMERSAPGLGFISILRRSLRARQFPIMSTLRSGP